MNHISQQHNSKTTTQQDSTQISIFKYDKDLVDTVEYGYKMAYNYWYRAQILAGLFTQIAGRYNA